MWPLPVFLLPVLLSSRASCSPDPHSTRVHSPRSYVIESAVRDSYDFIVVGGGLAGLVVASRLSEDANTTVLVIEAGETGDAVPASINPPSGTYYKSLVGTSYDWNHLTVPQAHAGNRVITWPRGKVLGGSSAINGMYYVRPSALEVDAWKSMIQSENGSDVWGWNNFLSTMKKSETFSPPSTDIQKTGNILFQGSSYGTSGPIHVSYPGFLYSSVGDWVPSLQNLGIAPVPDPNGGENYGSFVSTVSINPSNWTRSYSKSGYIDQLPPRPNLDILVSSTVTKIVFDKSSSSGQVATGVEFASSAGASRRTVKVKKEVILAGGALGSPHVLLLSGVGPKDVLQAAGVSVVSELPGVGQHLQDHLSAPTTYKSLVQTAGDMQATGSDFSQQATVLSFINSATAYINTSVLIGSSASEFQSKIQNDLQASANSLIPSRDSRVIEGYKAIYNITNSLLPSGLGQVELLLSINSPGQIAIQAALQHPYSQGRVYINSSSAFDPLVIDPQYFSHYADVQLLREGIKMARRLSQTAPLSNSLGDELIPGPDVATDEQIDAWLARATSTEFHPTATCAMLPESQGGVVNAKLQVYGLNNVRVVDSSVFPIAFSAHLGSATYGLAEAAAEIIRASYSPSNTAVMSTATHNNQPSQTGKSNAHNGASKQPFSQTLWIILIAIIYIIQDTII